MIFLVRDEKEIINSPHLNFFSLYCTVPQIKSSRQRHLFYYFIWGLWVYLVVHLVMIGTNWFSTGRWDRGVKLYSHWNLDTKQSDVKRDFFKSIYTPFSVPRTELFPLVMMIIEIQVFLPSLRVLGKFDKMSTKVCFKKVCSSVGFHVRTRSA